MRSLAFTVALAVGALVASPSEVRAAVPAHESTKSPQELSGCLAKHLNRSGRLREGSRDRIYVVERDKLGREVGSWEVIPTPEGSAASFRAKVKSARSAVNGDSCV